MKSYEPDYFKNYYKENKEQYKELRKKWLEENKDYWNAYQRHQSKLRHWKKKLELNPDDIKTKERLEELLKELPPLKRPKYE